MINDLGNSGADVEPGSDVDQPFFSVTGRILSVNGNDVQVFEFPSREDAQATADTVAPDDGSIGTSMVHWIASPHFYSIGAPIVLYVGDDPEVLTLLEDAVGGQFAGRTTSSPSVDPSNTGISEEADRIARRELSSRLGVAPQYLELVYSRESEAGNSALGTRTPAFLMAQVIVPSYVLLYQLNWVRYTFRISKDGRMFTDCRRKNNVAVPFRLADDIVNIQDAFQFAGGTPSHLGKEVVLQTRAEAQSFLAESGGQVGIYPARGVPSRLSRTWSSCSIWIGRSISMCRLSRPASVRGRGPSQSGWSCTRSPRSMRPASFSPTPSIDLAASTGIPAAAVPREKLC